MQTYDSIRKFYESSTMQILIELIDYELIYVDKIILSFWSNIMYGRGQIESDACLNRILTYFRCNLLLTFKVIEFLVY